MCCGTNGQVRRLELAASHQYVRLRIPCFSKLGDLKKGGCSTRPLRPVAIQVYPGGGYFYGRD
jgi:hypothetical protein